jgi:hypothetical protein
MESRKRRCPSANRMSKAKVLLPEPLTPVTTTNFPRGMSTEMLRRLCSRAPWMRMTPWDPGESFSAFDTAGEWSRPGFTANGPRKPPSIGGDHRDNSATNSRSASGKA